MDKDKDSALSDAAAARTSPPSSMRRKRFPRRARSGRGRLIFALDATMSRQPTWDLAQSLQAKMFEAAGSLGGLDVQLVYFRGLERMPGVELRLRRAGARAAHEPHRCARRIDADPRVLAHARDEAKRAKVGALIFIGDAMEENPDTLASLAGELALLGVKAFMFQEGQDPAARRTFGEIARLTGGAYSAFDAGASARLAALLRAAAAYAAGGHAALVREAEGDAEARLLLSQMRGT